MKQFSSNVGELKNRYVFPFSIPRQWHLISRHYDMVLPWDSGLIPRGMPQGFVLNMASVQTHQRLQPECKKKLKIIKDHERGISLHNISSYINHVFIFQNSHQHLKTFQFFFFLNSIDVCTSISSLLHYWIC